MADPGFTLIPITVGIGLFTSLLPSAKDVAHTSTSDIQGARDVRIAEIGASGVTIGVGALTSWLSHSKEPLLVAILIAASMILFYEWTLSVPPISEG